LKFIARESLLLFPAALPILGGSDVTVIGRGTGASQFPAAQPRDRLHDAQSATSLGFPFVWWLEKKNGEKVFTDQRALGFHRGWTYMGFMDNATVQALGM
jgi:hypothetical protein